MARLDRATQYSPETAVITGSPGLAFGSPEDDKKVKQCPGWDARPWVSRYSTMSVNSKSSFFRTRS